MLRVHQQVISHLVCRGRTEAAVRALQQEHTEEGNVETVGIIVELHTRKTQRQLVWRFRSLKIDLQMFEGDVSGGREPCFPTVGTQTFHSSTGNLSVWCCSHQGGGRLCRGTALCLGRGTWWLRTTTTHISRGSQYSRRQRVRAPLLLDHVCSVGSGAAAAVRTQQTVDVCRVVSREVGGVGSTLQTHRPFSIS